MQKKVRVLLFVDRMRHGGIQQFLVENVKHMDKTNLIVDVLTLDDGQTYPLEQTIKETGANYYKLKGIWINKITDYFKYAKAIDEFFENVLVMDKDEKVKQNRLALLYSIRQKFDKIADFSKFVF